MAIATINPATGETLQTFAPLGDQELDRKIERAVAAFREHRRTSFSERARAMRKAAEIVEAERRALAETAAIEMGKPIGAGIAEASKCALACRYYAENAERMLQSERVDTGAAESWVAYQPLGPILVVMPWNFPFWQVFRFIAPGLMAGNVGLLKHASNVPRCALAIESIVRRAGFAEGVFQTLLIGSSKVARMVADPRIAAVTLTGSEGAGMAVASEAGKEIKKTVLELGGSDPFIVMPSADIEGAIAVAVQARVINNGQSCIAAKRFIVHEAVAEDFERRMVARMERLTVGDPLDERTELGPLATADQRDAVEDQVRRAVAEGARVLTGGRRLDRPGFYYAPTVLGGVREGSVAAREEIFGPVAPIFRAKGLDHAIQLANATTFGLGASAWTRDARERARFVDEIEAGMVFINAMVASDPRVPFGGVKRSGYGRELGAWGLRELVNVKTVWIEGKAGEAAATE